MWGPEERTTQKRGRGEKDRSDTSAVLMVRSPLVQEPHGLGAGKSHSEDKKRITPPLIPPEMIYEQEDGERQAKGTWLQC